MGSPSHATAVSPGKRWTGHILGGLTILFLAFDTLVKVLTLPVAVEGTVQLGYPESAVLVIGIIELMCLVVYVIPRTSILGAVLLTAYLGGAVATHLRAGSPPFTHTLFPVYVGVLLWAALLLRDARLRALLAPLP